MKPTNVSQLMELLESCNPDANIYMSYGVEVTDIVSVDQPTPKIVVVKSDVHIAHNTAKDESKEQKTILAVKCKKCGAVYMAADLAKMGVFDGEDLMDAIRNGDELFLTACASLSMCNCER